MHLLVNDPDAAKEKINKKMGGKRLGKQANELMMAVVNSDSFNSKNKGGHGPDIKVGLDIGQAAEAPIVPKLASGGSKASLADVVGGLYPLATQQSEMAQGPVGVLSILPVCGRNNPQAKYEYFPDGIEKELNSKAPVRWQSRMLSRITCGIYDSIGSI